MRQDAPDGTCAATIGWIDRCCRPSVRPRSPRPKPCTLLLTAPPKAHAAGFTLGQPGCKFTKLLLYVVDPNARQRPADISEAEWQHALRKAGGAANADGLWPVAAHGFAQLQAHKEAQDAAVAENRGYLAELRAAAQQICATQEQELRQRAHRVLRNHASLAHRLLQV